LPTTTSGTVSTLEYAFQWHEKEVFLLETDGMNMETDEKEVIVLMNR